MFKYLIMGLALFMMGCNGGSNPETIYAFGEIYAHNADKVLLIDGVGEEHKVKITAFNANGYAVDMEPDYTDGSITVLNDGMYLVMISLTVESNSSGESFLVGFELYKNNGMEGFENVHAHRNLRGGGGDTGSVALSGLVDLKAGDNVSIWVWNESNMSSIIVDDITLSLIQIGV